MKFEINIEEEEHLAGITSSREAHNESLPQMPNPDYIKPEGSPEMPNPDHVPAEGNPQIANPDYDPTDEDSEEFISNPDYVPAVGEQFIPNPDYVEGTPDLPISIDDPGIGTNEEYVQFVMSKAAESYAKQWKHIDN